MNIYRLINELRILNKGEEFRFSDCKTSLKRKNTIYTTSDFEDIKTPSNVYVNGNEICFGSKIYEFVDILSMDQGECLPNVDVYKDIQTFDEFVEQLQRINPSTIILLGSTDNTVYIENLNEDLILPYNFKFTSYNEVTNDNIKFSIESTTNNKKKYTKTKFDIIKSKQLSYLVDKKRYLESLGDVEECDYLDAYLEGRIEILDLINSYIMDDLLSFLELDKKLREEDEIDILSKYVNLTDKQISYLKDNLDEATKDMLRICKIDQIEISDEIAKYTLISTLLSILNIAVFEIKNGNITRYIKDIDVISEYYKVFGDMGILNYVVSLSFAYAISNVFSNVHSLYLTNKDYKITCNQLEFDMYLRYKKHIKK